MKYILENESIETGLQLQVKSMIYNIVISGT